MKVNGRVKKTRDQHGSERRVKKTSGINMEVNGRVKKTSGMNMEVNGRVMRTWGSTWKCMEEL